MKFANTSEIDIYPVGVLADLLVIRRALFSRDLAGHRLKGLREGWRRLRRTGRYLRERARGGDWRAVKNYFNGYLAEHATLGRRCGCGWTKARALRDLRAHLAEVARTGRGR